MKNAKPVTPEMLKGFEKRYRENPVLQAMTRALDRNAIESIACVGEARQRTQYKFSIDIPTMKVTSQNKSGRCWIFAGLNVLRERVGRKCNIEMFELSQNYIAFWDKFEKINYFLESVIDLADRPLDDRLVMWVLQTGIQDGGQWDMLVSLIKKYGLMPKDAMAETFQSGCTMRMNDLINTKLAQDAKRLRELYADGADSERLTAEKTRMLAEFYGMLSAAFGEPPKTFDFEYVDRDKNYHIDRNLTAQEFYKKYVGDDLDEYVSVINAPTKDKPYHAAYTVDYLGNVLDGKEIRYLNVEMELLKELIVKQLSDGEVVWFGSDVGKYGDRDSGVWDDKAYDYATAFQMSFDLDKEASLDYRRSAMTHAMVITGVNLDEAGRPTKWKIENSWADDHGEKGYYLMSDSWFDLYVYQAVIHKKYLSPALLTEWESAPIHLQPWDPMGSLAR